MTQVESSQAHRSFRLSKPASGNRSDRRPDVVVPAERARALLAAAAVQDVSRGGTYSPGPAGVQIWSGPWNAPTGGPGTAQHLGSVDWSWETPTTGYVTLYRVMITPVGTARGLTTDHLLSDVLALAGLQVEVSTATVGVPLPRDPFRSESWATPALTQPTQT